MLLLAEGHTARRWLSWEREWRFILEAPGTRGPRLFLKAENSGWWCSVSKGR